MLLQRTDYYEMDWEQFDDNIDFSERTGMQFAYGWDRPKREETVLEHRTDTPDDYQKLKEEEEQVIFETLERNYQEAVAKHGYDPSVLTMAAELAEYYVG